MNFLLWCTFSKEPVTLSAAKLFPEADPIITMTVTMPDERDFLFEDGTTDSDPLPCENYKHHFSKNRTSSS